MQTLQPLRAVPRGPVSLAPPPPTPPDPQMMEALSERLLRHGGVQMWRQVFLSPVRDTIEFAACRPTLLVSDDPFVGISRSEGALLARELGGGTELSGEADLVLSFDDPLVATRAALVLQRLCDRRQVRTALTTGDCVKARFTLGGECRELVIGHGIARAERSLRKVVPGMIVLCGDTYRLLGTDLDDAVRDAIVATESQGDAVTQVSITLAPAGSAAMSTFAGLGRD